MSACITGYRNCQALAQRDPAFRKAMLQEGVECLVAGDIDTGKAVLRDYINATLGFEELSRVFDQSIKSLMRMFGPKGNPRASNLFAVIHYLQEQEGIHLEVKARKVAWGAVWQRLTGNFSGQLAGILEHGICHGITAYTNT